MKLFNTVCFLKMVPSATYVLWDIDSAYKKVYTEVTVFKKPAVSIAMSLVYPRWEFLYFYVHK